MPETLASRPALENSITGSAVLRAEVVYLAPGDPLLRKHVMPGTPQSDEDAILVAPLVVGDHVVGTLNVWREDEPAWFQPEESLLLRRFASLAAMAYANSAQREQLRIQALTDELTGLFNRRHFEHCLSRALRDERDRGGPTSVVYFDVDAFKAINDTFGHAAGDQVLREFSEVLRAQSRRDDIPCRTGGEEFCLVLPRTSSEEAKQVADRVVDAVRAAHRGRAATSRSPPAWPPRPTHRMIASVSSETPTSTSCGPSARGATAWCSASPAAPDRSVNAACRRAPDRPDYAAAALPGWPEPSDGHRSAAIEPSETIRPTIGLTDLSTSNAVPSRRACAIASRMARMPVQSMNSSSDRSSRTRRLPR